MFLKLDINTRDAVFIPLISDNTFECSKHKLCSDEVESFRRIRSFFGGGVHFKVERTSCQLSIKYISLYNTEGAPFSTVQRKETSFCVRKIRNIILSITDWK